MYLGVEGSLPRHPRVSTPASLSALDLDYDRCGFVIELYHCFSGLEVVRGDNGMVRPVNTDDNLNVTTRMSVVGEIKRMLSRRYDEQNFKVVGSQVQVNNGRAWSRGWPRPIGEVVEK